MDVDIYHPRVYGSGNVGRLSISGPNFIDKDGNVVIRKSLTAFCAPKRYAEGRLDEVRAYLQWAVSQGFNEVRVFSRVDWTGPPGIGVESGWEYNEAACEQLLTEAAGYGLRVEVVAHTGKYGSFQQMASHLEAVDKLCQRHDNALLEIYNEPQQNGGNDLVYELIKAYPPRTPGWASGVYDPTPYPAGQSMTYHSPRKDEWSRCTKDSIEYASGSGPNTSFSPGYPGPVMLDEPPQFEQTIRDQDHVWPAADDWMAYGAGCGFFGCGGTAHGNPEFQKCIIPTSPAMLDCVKAFIAGFNTVPPQHYQGYNRGDPPSNNPGSRRYFRWDDNGRAYEICIRPFSFKAMDV